MAPESAKNVKCSHCEGSIRVNSPSISCALCLSWFHKGCSGLSASGFNKQASLWKKNKETTWTCPPCQDLAKASAKENTDHIASGSRSSTGRLSIGPGVIAFDRNGEDKAESQIPQHSRNVSLNDIMDKLNRMESRYDVLLAKYEEQMKINADLKAEIADIRMKLHNGSDSDESPTISSYNDLMSESIREMSERQLRQKNLIIFGLNEATPTDINTRGELDVITAKDIIHKCFPGANTQQLKVFRIGREQPSKKRPIKVILQSANEVRDIIRNVNEIKKLDKYKNISLSFDKTPKQIEEYKALKETLTARLRNGETNIKIKYINGFPKIVNSNLNLNY